MKNEDDVKKLKQENARLLENFKQLKITPVPDQSDCKECQETCRLGEPRCRWCMDKIYTEVVLKLQDRNKSLREANEELLLGLYNSLVLKPYVDTKQVLDYAKYVMDRASRKAEK